MARNNVNSLIKLSPTFEKDFNRNGGGSATFQKQSVTSVDIEKLIKQLSDLKENLKERKIFDKFLISIKYKSVVPKSRRIKRIFKKTKFKPQHYVVGSKFYVESGILKHQISYFVDEVNLDDTILLLKNAKEILDSNYNGVFLNKYLDKEFKFQEDEIFNNVTSMKKCPFHELICDISNIASFVKNDPEIQIQDDSVVSFMSVFTTTEQIVDFLSKIGITKDFEIFDLNTIWFKNSFDIELLLNNAGFIVTQSLVNANDFDFDVTNDSTEVTYKKELGIPKNEPVIGVFDSYFDGNAYFSEWVETVPCLEKELTITNRDKIHGTSVCNILVDGPRNNGWLEDNCGSFRVKLFEVGTHGYVDVEFVYRNLERIVSENKEIKVWNFSLGSTHSVSKNEISLLGAKIDYISKKYNVIFVISGTNYNDRYPEERCVGSPADSLNSIVVNSVNRLGKPASYCRTGPVLSLYIKPDVSYYGGEKDDPIYAYSPSPDYKCIGTSFAAPWIARKLAYLIHYMHLEPLTAKALIIDSASKWDKHEDIKTNNKIGYGIVPIKIEEIIYSDSDEIKFVISDVTLKYITKITTIPVPYDNVKNKFFYTAKATLCYFTEGERKNGVDYSSIEMDLKFGRTILKTYKKDNSQYISVDSIDQDRQHEDDGYVNETSACIEFQKWNNTKHLVKPVTPKMRGIGSLYSKFWGLSITQIDRINDADEENSKYGLRFSVVITIKHIKGDDAPIETFLHQCSELNLRPISLDQAYNIKLFNQGMSEIKWK